MWGDGAGDGWLLCWMCSGGEKAKGGYVLQAGGIDGCSRQGVQWYGGLAIGRSVAVRYLFDGGDGCKSGGRSEEDEVITVNDCVAIGVSKEGLNIAGMATGNAADIGG